MKNSRLCISTDIDDVVADFISAAILKLGPPAVPDARNLVAMYPDRESEARLLISDGEFHYGVPPLAGAPEGIREMVTGADCDIVYVSARLPEFGTLTRAWLWHWRFPMGKVFCVGRLNGNKADRIKELGASISIDDSVVALDEISLLTVAEPIVFDRPWNASYEAVRMHGWQDWRRALKEAGIQIKDEALAVAAEALAPLYEQGL